MAIPFHPKPGLVLYCDFEGYVQPEIIKRRPVVVVSPEGMKRPGLVTVVPLSTTPPKPVQPWHYKLQGNPIPGHQGRHVWAKCDLAASVRLERLDRVKVGRRQWEHGRVSMVQVRAIRLGIARSVGIDPENPRTYTEPDSGKAG